MNVYESPASELENQAEFSIDRHELSLGKMVWGIYWRYYAAAALSLIVSGNVLRIVFPERAPDIVKLTPTIIGGLDILIFIVMTLVTRKGFPYLIRGKALSLPDNVWKRFNLLAICVMAFMAILNMVVAYQFDEDIWVKYKLFGASLIGLVLPAVCAFHSLNAAINLTNKST